MTSHAPGLDWYRIRFLILAMTAAALTVLVFVENSDQAPSLAAALFGGGLAGLAFITIRDSGVRQTTPPAGDLPSTQVITSPETAPQTDPTAPYPPTPYQAPVPPARTGGYGLVGGITSPPSRGQVPVRAPSLSSRDDDPPVLEGGTAAGRSPWRLPIGHVQSGIAADAAQLGDLTVRAASVIGPGHRCEEPAIARQDAYALMRASSGSHLIVAVADGLSSSAKSEFGARVAVSAAARTVHQALEASPDLARLDAYVLFQAVAGEMLGTGRSRAIEDDALCSLLIVAVIPATAQPDGSRQVWTAQVGDVSLWLHGRNGWSQRTGKSKQGFDRDRVDAALPFNAGQVVAGFVDVPRGAGVAVMTDGLGDTLSDVASAEKFFTARWAEPPHLARFVSDLCFDARGQIDDRTAVVVWCGHNA